MWWLGAHFQSSRRWEHPWSPQWQRLMTAPGVRGSVCHLLPKLMQVVPCCQEPAQGEVARKGPAPHASSKQWHLASKGSQTSSAYTFGCGHTRLQPFLSVSSWQPQSFPWVWATKAETQHCDPSSTSDHVSQVGERRAEAMTVLCRFLSILAATNWLLSSLLWLQSSPSVEADLPSGKETFQTERTFPLSQLSGECQFYPDFSLFFFLLSYLVTWVFSCPFRSLRFSANTQ